MFTEGLFANFGKFKGVCGENRYSINTMCCEKISVVVFGLGTEHLSQQTKRPPSSSLSVQLK